MALAEPNYVGRVVYRHFAASCILVAWYKPQYIVGNGVSAFAVLALARLLRFNQVFGSLVGTELITLDPIEIP
jgi:hypothetical protein